MNLGVSCTEIKITCTPPAWVSPPFESVALVPGAKTVVTTLRMRGGKESGLDADKFALGPQEVTRLMLRLAAESESFLNQVHPHRNSDVALIRIIRTVLVGAFANPAEGCGCR
jgi:hypothetical protein